MIQNTSPTMQCKNHPQCDTLLRCNQCDAPICPQCAVSTPTGYRCKDCIKKQQKRFDSAQTQDYLLCGIVAASISFLGAYLLLRVGFISGFFALLIGPAVGLLITRIVRFLSSKRRSKKLTQTIAICAAVGGGIVMVWNFFPLLVLLFGGYASYLIGSLIQIGWGVLYIFLVCTAILTDLGGIRIRR